GSVVFIGTPHDNVDPPPSPWQQTIPQAFQHTLTVFTKCLAKEYGHCGITINHLSLASNAESALPEILRFFLSTRSAYITGQRVNIYPIHTNPKRWSDVLPHFGKPPQAQTDANHNTNKAPLALITGASGGIGQAIAQRLAQDHYRLIIVDHPKQRFPLRQLAEQTGGMALTLDLCQANAARLISDRVHECGGKLNALVHNAGITRDRLFYNLSDSDWRTVISTNLLAPITITEHLLEQQQLAQHGRIVLMSSVMALSGHSGQSNYCVSKAGFIGFMEAIGPTLRAQHRTINAIAPGYIDTPMTRRIPVLLREIAKRLNVFAQMGAPEDVAEAVALCCHPASSGLQQNVLRVCGLMPLGA
ncbi:MAG: SDR family oxidoreductase, partial [Gammaproteobacteria bacterium]